jgi:hypothetical protein
VLSDVGGTAILPGPPEHTDPRAGEDPDRVGMITAAGPGVGIDGGGPSRSVARVISPRGEGLAEAFVTGPAEDDAPVFAGGVGHGRDTRFGGELVGGGEASAVVAELSEDLGGVDGSTAREALDERAIRVLDQRGRDRCRELLDLGDERREDGDQGVDEFPASPVRLRGASRRRVSSSAAERRPQ